MTGVPVQGAGTDDELRKAYAGVVHWWARRGLIDHRSQRHILDALLSDPGVLAAMRRREQQAAAKALDEARQYARTATQQGFAEGRGQDFTRHWAATAGWLKSRIKALDEGREPDWPDAAYSHAADLDPNGRPDQ